MQFHVRVSTFTCMGARLDVHVDLSICTCPINPCKWTQECRVEKTREKRRKDGEGEGRGRAMGEEEREERKRVEGKGRMDDEETEGEENYGGAAHAVHQTKNDELRWGPDGGQKHATGPKPQALLATDSLTYAQLHMRVRVCRSIHVSTAAARMHFKPLACLHRGHMHPGGWSFSDTGCRPFRTAANVSLRLNTSFFAARKKCTVR
ncbi:hypothetical protein KM043_017873 [Ampulex compressa]|nr:hypothetical protein KM043_017873 [Ampulex compressa]